MKNIKEQTGEIVFFILAFFPVFLWLLMLPIEDRFGGFMLSLNSLGQITGLVGLAMFALTLVLSIRPKILEDYFGGMNRVYMFHRLFGGVAFLLILMHPLFLMAKFIPVSLKAAALFLLPGQDLIIDLGMYALLLMLGLLFLTLFTKIRYQIWKQSHKFLGLAFFLAGLHVFFIPSDVARDMPLRAYILTLGAVGLGVFVYRTVLGRFLVPRYRYTVSAVRALDNTVTEIELRPNGNKLNYNSGQFVFISFHGKGISREEHPFSIVSDKAEENLRIIVKSLGDYTSLIPRLSRGVRARVEGPFGRFSYKNSSYKKQVWIAGGIGITPFYAMANSLVKNNDNDYQIDLYYCVRSEEEAVIGKDLESIAAKHKNIRIVHFCSNDHGWINAGFIRQKSGDLINKDIFMCGPPRLMNDLKKQFIGLNVMPQHIHSEEFNFY